MGNTGTLGPFTVMVADNFHYMEEDESVEFGRFETIEAAIGASKEIVDSFLRSALKPGMSAEQLYEHYVAFGDDPFILGATNLPVPFSAWEYAKGRCAEICPSPGEPVGGRHDD